MLEEPLYSRTGALCHVLLGQIFSAVIDKPMSYFHFIFSFYSLQDVSIRALQPLSSMRP